MKNRKAKKKLTALLMTVTMATTCIPAYSMAAEQADEDVLAQAQTRLDAANAAVQEAQSALDEANAAYSRMGLEFLNEKAGGGVTLEAMTQAAKDSAALKKYANSKVYDEAVNSAVTIDNLNKAADFVTECNNLRAKHDAGALKINYRLMCFSAVSAAISASVVSSEGKYEHTTFMAMNDGAFDSVLGYGLNGGENLAWGYADPFDGWYTKEKETYDKYVSSGNYPGLDTMDGYEISQKYTKEYYEIGHYLNIVDTDYNITGFARTTANVKCDQQCFGYNYSGIYGESVAPAQFKRELADYSKEAKAAVEDAKTTLDSAKKEQKTAKAEVTALKKAQEESENAAKATSIKTAKVTGIKDKVYTGSALKQSIKVTIDGKALSASDYSVTYKNNKNVGKATVTIKGKGNYTGSLSKTFVINPKGTTIAKATGAKKAFTVKWKKQAAQTTGYQIRYSLKSSMASPKSVNVTKTSTLSKSVKKLKKNKKYFVQIRTYKTVSGKKYYSAWSKTKAIKTK